jgi:hypothetical protein
MHDLGNRMLADDYQDIDDKSTYKPEFNQTVVRNPTQTLSMIDQHQPHRGGGLGSRK